MWGSRVLISCVLVTSACAGDNRLDPSELELRDLLGVAPETAMAWDGDQRAAARQVIDAGMHEAPPAAIHASLGREPTLDRSIANALSVADIDRAKHRLAALGVVELAVGHDELQATPHLSTLASKANVRIELELAGWTDRPGWGQLPARGLDVLTTIATDAGHRSGPVIVTPAPQLAVIAGYVPATSTSAARLYVNPVLLASLEPTNPSALAAVALAAPDQPVRRRGPQVLANDSVGNPYSFYSSVAECANAQATRCEACLPNSNCTPISGSGDGNAECTQLAADQGRGYSLICINYALAIDSVESCTATTAPTCPIDPHAGEQFSSLEHNADFLDKPGCATSLDVCLGNVFGTPSSSSTTSPNTSVDCSDSACDASSCDSSGCDGSCGDSSGADSGCSSSDSSSCDSGGDSGGDCSSGGGDCSGDSSGGCSGGDSGGDCSGGGGGDCSGGGGGGDCDAGGHHRHGSSTSFLWACLPLPFAIIARRRADRRRGRREVAP